jgi:hypothetical protein
VSTPDVAGYGWRWWLNLGLGGLTVLSIIADVIRQMGITGEYFGFSVTTWHDIIFVLAVATAINTLVNRTPVIQQPPTKARIQVENIMAVARQVEEQKLMNAA